VRVRDAWGSANSILVTPDGLAGAADTRTRGSAARCWCQRYKLRPKEAFSKFPAEERAFRLRQQCSGKETAGLIAYLDGEPAGWCAVEPRTAYEGHERAKYARAIGYSGKDGAFAPSAARTAISRARAVLRASERLVTFAAEITRMNPATPISSHSVSWARSPIACFALSPFSPAGRRWPKAG